VRLSGRHLVWIGPLIVLVVELPLIWTSPHVGDWFTFWYAGRLVADGLSPYDPLSWLPATTDYGAVAHGIAINLEHGVDLATLRTEHWLWPPLGGILLVPFGALPLELGIPLLHLATIVVAVGSALALVRVLVPAPLRPLALTLLLASPSLVQPMRASTLTICILPGIVLLFADLTRARAPHLAVAALGLSVRPQLFLAALPTIAAVYLTAARRRALVLAAAGWVVVNAAAFAISPVPLDPSLFGVARAFTLDDNSSTWRLAWLIAGDGVSLVLVAVAMLAVALALCVAAVRRAPRDGRDRMLIACALAFAVALAPYTYTYDHLALFPAWLLALTSVADAPVARRLTVGLAVIAAALVYGWSAYFVGAAGVRAAIGFTPFLALALLASTSARPSDAASERTLATSSAG
jgi:hypothetical protein